jgi:hypothetical protein
METIRKSVILNYDLGVRGNYAALYRLLDNLDAKEICEGSTSFEMDFTSSDFPSMFEELKEYILSEVEIKNNDRMYALFSDNTGQLKGGFLFGTRRVPIWAGHGYKTQVEYDTF